MESAANRRLALARLLLERADDLHVQMNLAAAADVEEDDAVLMRKLPGKTERVTKVLKKNVTMAKHDVGELSQKALKAQAALKKAKQAHDRALNLRHQPPRAAMQPLQHGNQAASDQDGLIAQCKALSVSGHKNQTPCHASFDAFPHRSRRCAY